MWPVERARPLEHGVHGHLSAQNGPWALSTDLLYVDLSNTKVTPLPLYGDGTLGIKLGALSGYALHRVTQASPAQIDIGAGFRRFDLSASASLDAGPVLTAASAEVNGAWTDVLVAAKVTIPLNDKWFLLGMADLGGTGDADDQTYQAMPASVTTSTRPGPRRLATAT